MVPRSTALPVVDGACAACCAMTTASAAIRNMVANAYVRMVAGRLSRRELEQLAFPGRVGIGIAGAAVGEHINRAVRSDLYVADAGIHFRQQGFLVDDLVGTD